MPTPPKTTSLIERLANGTAPPSPVSDSNAALTAPVDVAVVTAVHKAELATPNRCSLPSMFGPSMPAACSAGEPCCSAA